MLPYLTVPFSFTENSYNWIQKFCEPIVLDYQKNALLNSALISLDFRQVEEIKRSVAWQELIKFSNVYGLSDPWPQLFIYKELDHPRPVHLGNPHIDTYGPAGIAHTACIRFNVLLNGEDTTEMVWWNVDRNNKLVTTHTFIRPDLTQAGRLQIVGDTVQAQWANLGEPDYRAAKLACTQEYASFVRTDIVHALNWTGNKPRLVFSVRYSNSWSDLASFIQ